LLSDNATEDSPIDADLAVTGISRKENPEVAVFLNSCANEIELKRKRVLSHIIPFL
jgi:hypothetical protein